MSRRRAGILSKALPLKKQGGVPAAPTGTVHLLRQNATDILTTEKTAAPHNQLTTQKT